MADQKGQIRAIIAEMDRLISGECYPTALCYIEDVVLPILPKRINQEHSPTEVFDLLLRLGNIFYLNSKYEEAQHYLSIVKNTDQANESHDFIILWALLMIEEGRYIEARRYLVVSKNRSWTTIQSRTFDFHIGMTYFWQGDYKEATKYFQKCRLNGSDGNYSFLRGCADYMLGYTSFNRCFFKLAETYYWRALSEFKNLNKHNQIGKTYKQLGILLYRTGRYSESKTYIALSLKHFRKCSNRIESLKSRIALARIYMFVGDKTRSFHLLKGVYTEAIKLGLIREKALACEFLGELYIDDDNYMRAFRYLKEAAQIAIQIAPKGDISVEVYRRMAEACLARRQLDIAERIVLKGIEVAEELDDKYELGSLLRVYGLIHLEKSDIDLARSYFCEAVITLKLIRESYELAKTYRAAAESYERVLNSSSALPEEVADFVAEARDYAIEAMHLYVMLELDQDAEKCKKLYDRIGKYSHMSDLEITSTSLEFKSKWIFESSVVGRSKNIDLAIQKARLIAPSDISVLVTGETGTGKELIARLLHELSSPPILFSSLITSKTALFIFMDISCSFS